MLAFGTFIVALIALILS
ncbi:putative holin-like toxin [Lactiplantibacillus plantarum]